MSDKSLESAIWNINETYCVTQHALLDYQKTFLTILDKDHALESLTHHLQRATQRSPNHLFSQYLQFQIRPQINQTYLIENIRLVPSAQKRMDRLRAFYTTDRENDGE